MIEEKKFSLVKRNISSKKEEVVYTGLLQPFANMLVRQNNDAQNLMAGKYLYFLKRE